MVLFNKNNPAAPPGRLLSYQVANLQEIGAREDQEDAFAFVNPTDVTEIKLNGLLAVVADGMGGMKDGRLASRVACTSLREDFRSMDRQEDLSGLLRKSVFEAGDRIAQRLDGVGGTTIVACIFFDEKLYYCSVGDSSLFLLRGGSLCRVNREHNVLHERYLEAIREGSGDPLPARSDPEAHALSQFLGMKGMREADLFRRPLRLCDGDVVLLCSDGVSGVLSDRELVECLSARTATAMCAALNDAVRRVGSVYQDNYTALVIKCEY